MFNGGFKQAFYSHIQLLSGQYSVNDTIRTFGSFTEQKRIIDPKNKPKFSYFLDSEMNKEILLISNLWKIFNIIGALRAQNRATPTYNV